MNTHVEFRDKEGCTHVHPIKDMIFDTYHEVIDDKDETTYKINNYEVYKGKYDCVLRCLGYWKDE